MVHLCDLAWRGEMRQAWFSLLGVGLYCMVGVESAASVLGHSLRSTRHPPAADSELVPVGGFRLDRRKSTTRICRQIRVEDFD